MLSLYPLWASLRGLLLMKAIQACSTDSPRLTTDGLAIARSHNGPPSPGTYDLVLKL